MVIDVENVLVHDGRGRGVALGLEDVLAAVASRWCRRMLLDLGKDEGLPVVEGGEILAKEDVMVVSGRGECRKEDCHRADEHDQLHGVLPAGIRRWSRCRWSRGLPCSRSSGRRCGSSRRDERVVVEITDVRGRVRANGQAEDLVEIAVIEPAVPAHAQQGAAHDAVERRGIEGAGKQVPVAVQFPGTREPVMEPSDGHVREGDRAW